MTSTITEHVQTTDVVTFVLRSNSPPNIPVPENKSESVGSVQNLMDSVRNSGLLPDSSTKKIEEMNSGYASLENPTPREEAILLFLMIDQVIYPAIEEASEDEIIDKLLAFEDEAKKILTIILPEGTDIDKYLEQLSVEQVVIKRLALYESFCEFQLNLMEEKAESVNSQMIRKFEEIKRTFLEFSASLEAQNRNLEKEVDKASEMMKQLAIRYDGITARAQHTANEFNGLQNTIKDNSRIL